MKKLMVTMLFMISLIATSGCKKDEFSEETVRKKIWGKWKFISEEGQSDFASPGEVKLLIIYGKPGDYFLFDTEGKLTYVLYATKNTTTYTIEGNGQIKFDDNYYTIDKLTDDKLKLSIRKNNYDDTQTISYNFTK